MLGGFTVKCERCGTMLETEPEWSGKNNFDREGKRQKITCPRCHLTTTFESGES